MSGRGLNTLHRPTGGDSDPSDGSTRTRSRSRTALRVGTAVVVTGGLVGAGAALLNQGERPTQGGDTPAGVPKDGSGEGYPAGAEDIIRTDLLKRPGVADAAGRLLATVGGDGTIDFTTSRNFHHTDDRNPGISYDRAVLNADEGRTIVTIQFGGDKEMMMGGVPPERQAPVAIRGAGEAYCDPGADTLYAFGAVPVSVEVKRTDGQQPGFTNGCQGPMRDLAAALVAEAAKI